METVLVVEKPGYKNFVFTLDDDAYGVAFENAESDEYDFQTSVMSDTINQDWSFEKVATIELPVYKVVRKVRV